MKRENVKKGKLWLWVVIGLAVIAAAVAAVLLLLPQGQQVQQPGATKLYWNVDRLLYTENSETGLTTREPGEDGLYHVRLACDGQLVEVTVADKQLINYLDMMQVVVLVQDADGLVVDVQSATTVATEVAREFYIQAVEEDSLTVNSSFLMNGMEITVPLTQQTGIYYVAQDAENPGETAQCQIMDGVYVYADDQGNATHVFVSERLPEAGVYWRLERMYDAVKGTTTRKPDENGVYVISFAHAGKQVELKCKDKEMVSLIDSQSILYCAFGFTFDEEGYIEKIVDAGRALRGKKLCGDGYVTEINDDRITVLGMTAADTGKTYQFNVVDSTQIYMLCQGCCLEYAGEPTEALQYNDRIWVCTDFDNNAKLIFVSHRAAEAPLYYNVTRMYEKGSTSRVPDAAGYYTFEVIGDSGEKTVRTKDKTLAEKIDYPTSQVVGLILRGDIVEKVYAADCVSGGTAGGEKRYVTSMTSSVLFSAVASYDAKDIVNRMLSADVKIVDVTGYPGVKPGSKTDLRLHDQVTMFLDSKGEVSHAFVIQRYVPEAKLYYNTARRYDRENDVTTRPVDEDGYYVYDTYCEGKAVTVKTKSKALATFIDRENAPIVALEVKNGIVQKAYPAVAAIPHGYKTANFHYVDQINEDGTFTTDYIIDNVRYDAYTVQKLAKDCVVYNVSQGYIKNRGEKTTLKVGDQIQVLATNPEREAKIIFVMSRKINSPIYWKTEQKYNALTGETTRTPDADGWYVFTLAVNGQLKEFKTKDKAIASQVDSYTQYFAMRTDGDIILQAYGGGVAKGVSTAVAGNFDIMSLSGSKATVQRNYPIATNYGESYDITFAKNCKVYDMSSYAQSFGGEAKVEVGDRITCLTGEDGKVIYCFIVYKNTRKAGAVGLCQHCNKEVFWEPYTGPIHATDTHYYLTHDFTRSQQAAVGTADKEQKQNDVVLDLNGYTLTGGGRSFLVYGTLSILDSVGGGKIQTKGTNGFGGNILVSSGGTLNLYSGTLTATADALQSIRGGIVCLDGKGCSFNMYGGTITGGVAKNAANLYVAYGKFNMTGGILDGNTILDTATKATLSGSPVIPGSGLILAKDVKLTLGELTEKTSVVITASGAFTEPTEKAADYAGYFTAKGEGCTIVADGNVLKYVGAASSTDELRPDANGYAKCPVCEESVQWTAVTNGNRIGADKSGHYYLAEDVASPHSQFATVVTDGNVLCLHLNGKNLTLSGRIAMFGNGTLNIMGNGTVTETGSYNNGADAYTDAMFVIGGAGTINLHGGKYINLAEGKPGAIVRNPGKLLLGDISLSGDINATMGEVVLSGATEVTGPIHIGTAAKLTVLEDFTGTATAAFDAVIEENMIPQANGSCTGSYIGALYLQAEGTPALVGKDGRLVVDSNIDPQILRGQQLAALANAMTFPTDSTEHVADCPACGEKAAVWKPVTNGNRIGADQSGHYYLAQDNSSPYSQFATVATAGNTICLHLNGKTLTSAGRMGLFADGTINIMGTGAVVGTGSYNNGTDAFTSATYVVSGGKLNLYGGSHSTTAAGKPLVLMGSKVAALNVYADTILGGEKGTCPNTNLRVNYGTVNLYGGTVQNGTGVVAGSTTLGGNVFLNVNTALNLYAGTITGGTASSGGNICADGATVTVAQGAVISGGEATAQGGNIFLANGSVMTTAGTVTGGQTTGSAAHGGNISVMSGSVLNITGGTISGGIANGQGGNLRAYNATVTMTGGEIFGGDSLVNVNDNIWLAGSSTMTMTGGTVKGTDGTENGGTAIDLAGTAVLTLGGDARVIRDDGVSLGNVRLSSTTNKLQILNDWTGTASVRFLDSLSYGAAVTAAQCGSLTEETFTPGGSYTGSLVNENGDPAKIVGADGVLTLETAPRNQ